MATYSIKPAAPDGALSQYYVYGDLGLHGGSKATYTDTDVGYQLILTGENLFYDGQQIIGGTITGVAFKDPNGGTWYTITDVDADATQFPDVTAAYLPHNVDALVLSGNDKLVGSRGNDQLEGFKGSDRLIGKAGNDAFYGDQGRDTMTGGRGDDQFYIGVHDGHDVITDFKAYGDADQVIFVAHSFHTEDTKHGVLATADTGQSVLLEGLKVSDLHDGDITLLM